LTRRSISIACARARAATIRDDAPPFDDLLADRVARLSEVIGSWNTMARRGAAQVAHRAIGKRQQIDASKRTRPAISACIRGNNPNDGKRRDALGRQPDSPHEPSVAMAASGASSARA